MPKKKTEPTIPDDVLDALKYDAILRALRKASQCQATGLAHDISAELDAAKSVGASAAAIKYIESVAEV